jgi:hypothetical protein
MKYDNIPGWPGYYISKRGKVYSRKLPGHTGKSRFGNKWVLHKLSLHKGYYRVRFFDTRKHTKLFSVHRLVALAWVHNPKPKEYNVVMHLDNNPLNNYYKTLSGVLINKIIYNVIKIIGHIIQVVKIILTMVSVERILLELSYLIKFGMIYVDPY